jgi:hypothetical protein
MLSSKAVTRLRRSSREEWSSSSFACSSRSKGGSWVDSLLGSRVASTSDLVATLSSVQAKFCLPVSEERASGLDRHAGGRTARRGGIRDVSNELTWRGS